MRAILLIFFLSFFNFNYCQDVKIELLNAKTTTDNKVILTLKINNNSNENYVINKNFTFEDKAPDFSSSSYTKVNVFENDSVVTRISAVKFEKLTERNKNIKKYDVFFIKRNTSEIISFCLDDFLTEGEKIGLKMKMISLSNLSISLDLYQSGFLNIKKKKILNRIRKENYMIFRGQISTNKVLLLAQASRS
ncbi:hypothetical protein B0A80_18865 [Flavobacterium tructae]|uniref:hypothetical protein n=1 Tax=Flavobacterium tructae TaxID=1114873 RepID=UPI000B5B650D|nr:hypothetical protein [Flavobacterium tructae]OXB20620.1 hypothetical protein B0A80_18865 [Flavobacterium tructae]